jgi:hypothetical protein
MEPTVRSYAHRVRIAMEIFILALRERSLTWRVPALAKRVRPDAILHRLALQKKQPVEPVIWEHLIRTGGPHHAKAVHTDLLPI